MSLRILARTLVSSAFESNRKFLLAVPLFALALVTACSNNNSNTNPVVACPGAIGNYSIASLPANSQWTYEMSGWFINSSGNYTPYVTAGTFTADGKGHITVGFDEFFGGSFAGKYTVNSNGTGTISVNVNSGGTITSLTWGITLSNTNPGSIYLIEEDSSANAAGTAYQQTTSAFGAPPSGTFVFRTHVLTAATSGFAGASARVGVLSVSGGTVNTAASADDFVIANSTGAQGNVTAGSFTTPDSTGLGQMTLTDSLGASTFDYFVIDSNNYIWFETDSANGGLGLGRMEMQSNPGAYSDASLASGSGYVFSSRGDTSSSGAGGANTVGQFAVNGAGGITSGSFDAVRDGGPALGVQIGASTYNVAANGRVSIVLNGTGAPAQTAYMISGSRGFFLVNNDTTRVEDGTLEQQTAASFSGSNFSGQAAFVMGGANLGSSGGPLDRTGTITADGNGNIGWAEIVNSAGSVNAPGCLAGTYTVASNGRVAASVTSVSGNLIFYMVSPAKWYVIQGDSGVQIYGGATIQASPVIDPPGVF